MVKKIIQVPVEEKLLITLNRASRKQRKARAELIREACVYYLQKVHDEELDMLYEKGYREIPEESEIGESQVNLIDKILPRESW